MLSENLITKKKLSDSLNVLLEQKSFQKITVNDISQTSHLSRRTFYNYFEDKWELAYWDYKYQNDVIIRKNYPMVSWKDTLILLLDHHIKNEKTLRALGVFDDVSLVNQFLKEYTCQVYSEMIVTNSSENLTPEDLPVPLRVYCYGSAEMVYMWIREGMRDSSENIADGLMQSMPEIMKLSLGAAKKQT